MNIPYSILKPFGWTGLPTLFSTAQYMTMQECENIMQACDDLMKSLASSYLLNPPDPEAIRHALAQRAITYGAQWARSSVFEDQRDSTHFVFVIDFGRFAGVDQCYAVSTKRHAK
jgi:hypothetical protein